MDLKCENCIYCDKSKIYHNIFDSNIWYGCNYGWDSNHTEDVFSSFGDLKFLSTSGCKYICYKENLQCRMDLDNIEKN